MAKETRIGLLIGLMFIVAFGLILADLTRPADAPPAATPNAPSPTLWTATDLPVLPGPPDKLAPPTSAEPAKVNQVQVASADPVKDDKPSGGVIQLDPSLFDMLQTPAPITPAKAMTPPTEGEQVFAAAQNSTAQPAAPAAAVSPAPVAQAMAASIQPARVATPRTYVVKQGDTLVKIASAVYGAQNAAQYVRIYEANRKQMPNAATLRVGQALTIPELDVAPATVRAARGSSAPDVTALSQRLDNLANQNQPTTQPAPAAATLLVPAAAVVPPAPAQPKSVQVASAAPAAPLPVAQPAVAVSKSKAKVYVVQPKDTLSRIARRTLNDGSASAVRRLYEANRDRLASPDSVPVGVELVIPS